MVKNILIQSGANQNNDDILQVCEALRGKWGSPVQAALTMIRQSPEFVYTARDLGLPLTIPGANYEGPRVDEEEAP